jgi:SAM-dependent methyltransferase
MAKPPAGRSLTAQEWHEWFTCQAGWTAETRRSLYRRASLAEAGAVLEVGCGTGVITSELASLASATVIGLDIDSAHLTFARSRAGQATYTQGDAYALPFPSGCFDLVVSHYLLLWLSDARSALLEMTRVARPQGFVLACAEPDYGGRIDHPPELARIGRLQADALRRQGADPELGRRLGELFTGAGLRTTVGVLPGRWTLPGHPGAGFDAEWRMREYDLDGVISPQELHHLRSLDRQALTEGHRLLFVPTFYALGAKPGS